MRENNMFVTHKEEENCRELINLYIQEEKERLEIELC